MSKEYNLTLSWKAVGLENVILFKQIYSRFQHDASLKGFKQTLAGQMSHMSAHLTLCAYEIRYR